MAIVPDESRAFLGKGALAAQALYLNLFTNNQTVGAAAVVGSFTKGETSVTPGTSVPLAAASWSGSNSAGTYTATQLTTGGTFTFTYSASVGTIYGYAISTGTGLTGTLVGAENFSPAQVITANGDKISVVVKLLTA
jgi:hypothetical protein